MSVPSRYRPADLVLVRATTFAADLDLPRDIDLEDDDALAGDGRAWLARIWAHGIFREAVGISSPALAAQIDSVLSDASRVSARDLRRLIFSAISYLVRWQRRTTPFGLFAGIAAVASGGRANSRLGTDHRVFLRADAEWLATLVEQLEQHPQLRRRLVLSADSALVVRDGRVIVAGRPHRGETPGPVLELSVLNTRPVQAVIAACARPLRFDALIENLRSQFPKTAAEKIDQLLFDLIDQQVLTTSLRAPMTCVDGFTHLLDALHDAGAHELPDLKALMAQLEQIAAALGSGENAGFGSEATRTRRTIAAMMRAVVPDEPAYPMAVDTRLDAKIAIPDAVFQEAAAAAVVLVRLSTKPFGTSAWLNYQARFLARYGPSAVVPVLELVADSGLGYPAGYLGAPKARPTWRMVTERDAALLALIQRAERERSDEIELTESTIKALTAAERGESIPPQRVELAFDLHATTTSDIDRGRFELWIDAVPRSGSSMAGRFAYLLDEHERERLAASFQAEAPNAVTVQLSFPPRRLHNENIVRVPQLLPNVIQLSEFGGTDPASAMTVDELGVTADADQLYLVHMPTGRRVTTRTPHALEATIHTPPLARFLSEVSEARSAVYAPFNFGAARTLPYTPRIRYRRTVLAPARWLLDLAEFSTSRAADWDKRLQGWAEQWRVPDHVVLCDGELRLPLDLSEPINRTLLRTHLDRARRLELREAGGPEMDGWLGRPAQLLVSLCLSNPPARRPPARLVRPSSALNAGHGDVLHIELIGNPARFDEILSKHLPNAIASIGDDRVLRWWARRYRDLIRLDTDQHISLCARLTRANHYGTVAEQLAQWGDNLQARGLLSRMAIVSYQEQPGRYGKDTALRVAERVFATDTTAAIAQIAMAKATSIPAQALAAASMTALSAAFAPDPATGCRLLRDSIKQETGPLDRHLRETTLRLADPSNQYRELASTPVGAAVAQAWLIRDDALARYHRVLATQRDPSTVLRSLLHDHHVRALGVDPEFEATTNRLARSCALRRLALTEMSSR